MLSFFSLLFFFQSTNKKSLVWLSPSGRQVEINQIFKKGAHFENFKNLKISKRISLYIFPQTNRNQITFKVATGARVLWWRDRICDNSAGRCWSTAVQKSSAPLGGSRREMEKNLAPGPHTHSQNAGRIVAHMQSSGYYTQVFALPCICVCVCSAAAERKKTLRVCARPAPRQRPRRPQMQQHTSFSLSLYLFYPHVCRIIGSKLIERERMSYRQYIISSIERAALLLILDFQIFSLLPFGTLGVIQLLWFVGFLGIFIIFLGGCTSFLRLVFSPLDYSRRQAGRLGSAERRRDRWISGRYTKGTNDEKMWPIKKRTTESYCKRQIPLANGNTVSDFQVCCAIIKDLRRRRRRKKQLASFCFHFILDWQKGNALQMLHVKWRPNRRNRTRRKELACHV